MDLLKKDGLDTCNPLGKGIIMSIRIEKQTNTVAILRCQIPISDKEYVEFRRIKKQNERSAILWLRKQIF